MDRLLYSVTTEWSLEVINIFMRNLNSNLIINNFTANSELTSIFMERLQMLVRLIGKVMSLCHIIQAGIIIVSQQSRLTNTSISIKILRIERLRNRFRQLLDSMKGQSFSPHQIKLAKLYYQQMLDGLTLIHKWKRQIILKIINRLIWRRKNIHSCKVAYSIQRVDQIVDQSHQQVIYLFIERINLLTMRMMRRENSIIYTQR